MDLEITGLTGTVAHGLHVERVEIDHELVHLTFTNINGRVRLAPLLLQTIRVTYASVEGAEVAGEAPRAPAHALAALVPAALAEDQRR